jgi:hypothetical protein
MTPDDALHDRESRARPHELVLAVKALKHSE